MTKPFLLHLILLCRQCWVLRQFLTRLTLSGKVRMVRYLGQGTDKVLHGSDMNLSHCIFMSIGG